MIRRPPRSTLFPTRRSSDLPAALGSGAWFCDASSKNSGAASLARFGESVLRQVVQTSRRCDGRKSAYRSEEHTSELQSQSNLVCRLLLEKKKKKKKKKNKS